MALGVDVPPPGSLTYEINEADFLRETFTGRLRAGDAKEFKWRTASDWSHASADQGEPQPTSWEDILRAPSQGR